MTWLSLLPLTTMAAVVLACATPVERSVATAPPPVVSDSVRQQPAADTGRPVLSVVPERIVLQADSAGYAQSMVAIRNTGGGVLSMTSVKGSCGCASASVQRNGARPGVDGKIYVMINTSAFPDSVGTVEYTIVSNARNSPSTIRVDVHKFVRR